MLFGKLWKIAKRSKPAGGSGQSLSTAPQNKVAIVSKRHSGNLPAGIHKNFLDTGQSLSPQVLGGEPAGMTNQELGTYLCRVVLSRRAWAFAGMRERLIGADFQQAGQAMQQE
jgi:hypothetical protein